MTTTTVTFASSLKDLYPLPGTRIKQWVLDTRREIDWEDETCPRVDAGSEHADNTGAHCRNSDEVPWTFLDHDCCGICGDLHEATRTRPDIAAWIIERAARPPIEADRSKLSDEVEPDCSFLHLQHPFLRLLRPR